MHRSFLTLAILAAPIAQAEMDADAFALDVLPTLESKCLHCHNPQNPLGGLDMSTREGLLKGGAKLGPSLLPGDAAASPLHRLIVADEAEPLRMPPAPGTPIAPETAERIAEWIKADAPWPEGLVAMTEAAKAEYVPPVDAVNFAAHVRPIIEGRCIQCHQASSPNGNFTTREGMLTGGRRGPSLVPGQPAASLVHVLTTLPGDNILRMPQQPYPPLTEAQQDTLKVWVEAGAPWPEGLRLEYFSTKNQPKMDEGKLVDLIHQRIVETAEAEEAALEKYTATIPGTEAAFTMVPIPGGAFMMGSPEDEPFRGEDEGPRHKVEVSPFWMLSTEVTWDMYNRFRYPGNSAQPFASKFAEGEDGIVDAVSRPTKEYHDMSFSMGQDGFPAIGMTQHAANKFCQWLSAKTGHFYRLPTEAEWEYAARAGTDTAYHFGDDESLLPEYGWYYENADYKYHKVGSLKPNPWGLYDMHGNVTEWVLDQYVADAYSQDGRDTTDPWVVATKAYPHVVRGGSWDDDPDRLRSAARRGSNPLWKDKDPQIPKSIWYHTSTPWLGFRIVRPKEIPTKEEMFRYWNSGVEYDPLQF